MKTILLVIMFAAVVLASWFYNGESTIWYSLMAGVPVLLFLQSISISKNSRKAWGKARPETARTKAGMATKTLVWNYICSTAIFPFLWVAAFAMSGLLPLTTIIVFLTLPVAIGCSRTMFKLLDGATGLLADLPNRTTTLTLLFSLLLTVALLLGRFI